ncbi:MAG: GNAT family N-acetyltransferase [Nitrosomonas sp.]|nr:GNAT family N-acetyltransferase [Nitrosomonas sp.]
MMKYNMLKFEQTSCQVTSNVVPGTGRHTMRSSDINLADCKNLTFPLNVYAHVLLLETGQVEALHYGLFDNCEVTIPQAQQAATDLLLSHLPDTTKKILEVGVGLGTTFAELKLRGYQVQGITPDSAQIAILNKRFGQDLSIDCQHFENYQASPESWDLILFQESAQYIEPLEIFNQALHLLPIGGDILIMDEFSLRREKSGSEGLHSLHDMIRLAERMGFKLTEQIDLSTLAAPTLTHLLRLTTKFKDYLMSELSLDGETLDKLDESNKNYQRRYADGLFGYALLKFKKTSIPKWRVGILDDRHTPEMQQLFSRTFGHDMSPQMWHWKYGQHGSRALGVWRNDRLIAHYGGMLRSALLFGQTITAVQIGDVMVDSDERGILTRRGPFFLMAATFQESYVGFGKPILTGYGFPNDRAMRVAERLRLYSRIGSMVEIEWQPKPGTPHVFTRINEIDLQHAIWQTSIIDNLWQKMAVDFKNAIIGVRDSAYLRYRYLDHPHHHYQLLLVIGRIDRQIRGLIVLRHDLNETEIMDLIGPLQVMPLLISHARRVTGMHQKRRVFIRIPQNFAPCFTQTGGRRIGQEIPIPAPTWSQGLHSEKLQDLWWLTGGDMDFR